MQKKIDILKKFRKPYLTARILNKLLSPFYFNQWTVLLSPQADYKSMRWKDFKVLKSPLDRFWADPFPWAKDNKLYLFVEEFLYSKKRGHLSVLTLNKDFSVANNQVILEKPYHLSYPYIFEYKGEMYMIPESMKNNKIDLYRCKNFPNKWEHEETLIDNLPALDATLLEISGKWWLFANIKSESGSTFDTLHLYYSDNPLSSNWKPHPQNPIVKNIKSARPAGRIFMDNGKIIRPSQDCSLAYGYAINFNEIATLNEKEYKETRIHYFKPPPIGIKLLTTHTFNKVNGLVTIDAIQRRWRFD